MRIQLRQPRTDDGAVAVMVALLAVVLVGMAAFTTDFGMAYAQRQALATGADSASLAVVRDQFNVLAKNPSFTCDQLVSQDAAKPDTDSTKSSNIALTQVNENAPFGAKLESTQVQTTLKCVGSNSGTLQATVSVGKSVKTIFGGVFGVSSINIARVSAAALGAANDVRGLIPIAICTYEAQAIIANAMADVPARSATYRHEIVPLNKVWDGGRQCGTDGEGNWGWLYCTDNNGVPDLSKGIQNGCPGALRLDTSTTPASYVADGTPGDKGSSNPVTTAMQSIMDKTVTLPVYNNVTGPGANATYTVIGFLSVRMCAYDNNNNHTVSGACYVTTDPLVSSEPDNVVVTKNTIQVQYVGYEPLVGQVNPYCAIGDTTCAFNSYVTGLIR